ncbi:predicted protein [Pyrenophora tritici-repentis Pt-1C-BFP]|uniref:Uncharacterized protein n=1 Tax=Pyrenophora tritici-repentis (strain Pt-1C-BFP) TaxID=426418 RepID=B2VWX9_PYRTR|nr:uncharacterized protein PTRG_00216 [Pyrenophora tritici-repentis Pt-1C-BFP]EDU39654.1 predicted protein [Pyrenophora tritici-repentis Pt-1C-BFP]
MSSAIHEKILLMKIYVRRYLLTRRGIRSRNDTFTLNHGFTFKEAVPVVYTTSLVGA